MPLSNTKITTTWSFIYRILHDMVHRQRDNYNSKSVTIISICSRKIVNIKLANFPQLVQVSKILQVLVLSSRCRQNICI
jgi:hypothetical protein